MRTIGGSAARSTKLAVVVGLGVAVVVLAAVLVEHWGQGLLAALTAGILVLLAAHTVRAEQQHRRVHSRLRTVDQQNRGIDARLRKVETTVRRIRPDLKPIAAASHSSMRRLERMDEGFKDPKKFGLLREVNRISRRSFEQVQATINLFEMVEVRAAVPPMRLWAVSPDALALLVQEMLIVRPALVVECGSGTSTLWMALAAKQHGLDIRIVALDHEENYADKTNRLLRLHGVDDIAQARVAPLVDVDIDGRSQRWYDPSVLDDLDGIGLLFVDGPPAAVGPMARVPALAMLWDRCTPRVSIVVDDSIRSDETEMVQRWLQEHPELAVEHHDTEKGTEILRRG